MIRLVVVLAGGALASATCGLRPALSPFDADFFDGGEGGDAGLADCTPCEKWGPVQLLAPMPLSLESLSGLAVSAAHRGVLYAHNSASDAARFYALRYDGLPLAELQLDGASAVDWEDMAIGPCESGSCLYLADVGDPLGTRTDYAIFVVPEPDVRSMRPIGPINVPYVRLPFDYPNSARHDAQTLLVHPQTGDIYLLTKDGSGVRSHVYKFPRPQQPDVRVTLIDLGHASVPTPDDAELTGGSVHPCGNSVLLRLSNRVVELRQPDAGTFDSIFKEAADEVPGPVDEPQGEAVAWGPDGKSYFTASKLSGQSLHRVQCLPKP